VWEEKEKARDVPVPGLETQRKLNTGAYIQFYLGICTSKAGLGKREKLLSDEAGGPVNQWLGLHRGVWNTEARLWGCLCHGCLQNRISSQGNRELYERVTEAAWYKSR